MPPGLYFGLLSTSLKGPRQSIRWSSRFTRRAVGSGLGSEIYAFSGMAGRMAMAMGSFTIFGSGVLPMVGFEDCGSPLKHMRDKKTVAGKYLVGHFLRIQQFLGSHELGNVYGAPGAKNPANGLTKVQGDVSPLLRLPGRGAFCPGTYRPFRGASLQEGGRA